MEIRRDNEEWQVTSSEGRDRSGLLKATARSGSLGARAALVAAVLAGAELWAQEHTQPYVVRLREDAVITHLLREEVAEPEGEGRASLRRGKRVDVASAEALRYRAALFLQQRDLRRRIEGLPGGEVGEQMDTVFNGFAVRLRPEDVEAVKQLPDVADVAPSVRYKKLLEAALPLARAPEAWTNARIGGEDSAGRGVKIGVIDTGLDITHPMLQDASLAPPAGYPRFNAPTILCPGNDQLFTNSKVIVARNYVSLLEFPDPNCDAQDRDGHGTFVAVIAAGRRATAPLASLAGVAPKAFLGSYKVFGTPGFNDEVPLEALLKAVDDAVKDGMDVINISLGASVPLPPSADPLALAVSAAVDAGVTVVVAGGNDGPGTGTINSPGTAPGAITVGATSNSRILAHPLIIGGSVGGSVPTPPGLARIAAVESNGPALQSNVGPAGLTDVSAVDASGLACGPLPADALREQMVLIRRGNCTFSTKITNAFLAGAVTVVVYNNQFSQPAFGMDVGVATQIPSVMIGNAEGTAVAQFLASAGTGAQATLGAAKESIAIAANRLASFSSVGPSTDFGIKPDLLAPGTEIYSATQRNFPAGAQFDASGFSVGSGTSFSAPMVAGAAALVQQAWPTFTPAQVKSALVQTAAKVVVPLSDGISGALAQGNGLLDVAAALSTPAVVSPVSISFGANAPGSVLNSTASVNVTNVGLGGDTFTLSATPSPGSAVVNMLSSPATFTLSAGESRVVSVSAVSALPITGTVEGYIELRSQSTARTLTIPYWGNFLQPSVTAGGVLNSASFLSGPMAVAPGSLVSIFGSQMTAGTTEGARAIPLPESLAGVRVTMSGVPVPLLYVSPTQINGQVPQELAGLTFAPLQVHLNGVSSALASVFLAPTGPGIFTVNQSGTGRGAVLHGLTLAEVSAENPARPGEILAVYVNGLGATTPSVGSGEAASVSPLSSANLPVTAMLGGLLAPVRFAGLVPGLVGLYQVNIEVPFNTPEGEQLLIITSNGVLSNEVIVFVGR